LIRGMRIVIIFIRFFIEFLLSESRLGYSPFLTVLNFKDQEEVNIGKSAMPYRRF